MSKKPRATAPRYSRETKLEVLKLDKQGSSPFEISDRLNVPIPTLNKWIKDREKILKSPVCKKKTEREKVPKKKWYEKPDLDEMVETPIDYYQMFKPLLEKGMLGRATEEDLITAVEMKRKEKHLKDVDFYDVLAVVTRDRLDPTIQGVYDKNIEKLKEFKKKIVKPTIRKKDKLEKKMETFKIKKAFCDIRSKRALLEDEESEEAKLIAKETMELLQESDSDEQGASDDEKLTKPERKYSTKTTKLPEDIGAGVCDIPQIEAPVKPKRKYERKPKPEVTEITATKAKRSNTRKTKKNSTYKTPSIVSDSDDSDKPDAPIDESTPAPNDTDPDCVFSKQLQPSSLTQMITPSPISYTEPVCAMPERPPLTEYKEQQTVRKAPSKYQEINLQLDEILNDVKGKFVELIGAPEKKPNPIKWKSDWNRNLERKEKIKKKLEPKKKKQFHRKDYDVKEEDVSLGGSEGSDDRGTELQAEYRDKPKVQECPHAVRKILPLTEPVILTTEEKERRMLLYRGILHEMISDNEEDDEFSDTEEGRDVKDECISCTLQTEAEEIASRKDDIEDKTEEASCDYRNGPSDARRLESDSDSVSEDSSLEDVEMKGISNSIRLPETTNMLNPVESMRMDDDMKHDVVEDYECRNIEPETTTDLNEESGLINEKEFQMFENLPKEEKYAQLGLSVSDSDSSESGMQGDISDSEEAVERNTVLACENPQTNEFLTSTSDAPRKECDVDIGTRVGKTVESSFGPASESSLSDLNDSECNVSQLERDLFISSEDESDSSDTNTNCIFVSKGLTKSQNASMRAKSFNAKHIPDINDKDLMFYSNEGKMEDNEEGHTCNFCMKEVGEMLKQSNVDEDRAFIKLIN